MNFEQEILKLQETAVLTAELKKMQAQHLVIQERNTADHALRLADHDRFMEEHRRRMAEIAHEMSQLTLDQERRLAEHTMDHDRRMAHIDMRLAEITDKLDGLIGYMNGQSRRPNKPLSHYWNPTNRLLSYLPSGE